VFFFLIQGVDACMCKVHSLTLFKKHKDFFC
jgi:hypothetical protein